MTSSLRATGHASVRTTPVSAMPTPGTWTLADLTRPSAARTATETAEPAQPPVTPAVTAALLAEERERGAQEGYARGLADGEKKGMAAAQARLTETVATLENATEQLHELATLAPPIMEENIAALAVVVARQIVVREVVLDSDLVADLVRRALTEFPIDQAVRIRVHPLDLSVLTLEGIAKGGAPITGSRDASWLADPRITRGGCLVEGRDRIIDGRVDTALERAYRRMAQIDAS